MCEDCKGTGKVPLGFYAGFRNGIGANPQQEPCRRCARWQKGRHWFAAVSATMVTVALARQVWVRI